MLSRIVLERLVVGAGVGITKDLAERVYALQRVGADLIALDSATTTRE